MRLLHQVLTRLQLALIVFAMTVPMNIAAEDIRTNSGTVYRNAKILRAESDGIIVTHSVGVAKIPFEDLPTTLQQKYHYNPQSAKSFKEKEVRRQELTARPSASTTGDSPSGPTPTIVGNESRMPIAAQSPPQGASSPVPPPRPGKVSPSVLGAVVIISGPSGAGTGFLCSYKSRTYVATNQHVLRVGGPLSIQTSSGESLQAKSVYSRR